MNLKSVTRIGILLALLLFLAACASSESLTEKGLEQLEAGEIEQAQESFDRALEKDPEFAEAYYGRAQFFAQEGEYSLAAADLVQVMTLAPDFAISADMAEVFDQRGLTLHGEGQLSQAIADFDRSVTLDESYTSAYYHRAASYLADEQFVEAAADITQVQELDPDFPIEAGFAKAYCELADMLKADGEPYKALENYDATLAIDPDFLEGLLGRATLYLEMSQFDEAAADLDHALAVKEDLKLNTSFAQAFYERALNQRSVGDLDLALADLDQAVTIDDRHTDAFLVRGEIHETRGNVPEATSDLRRVLYLKPNYELNPKSAETFFQCSLAHVDDGSLAIARADLEQALAIDPEHAGAIGYTGLLMVGDGDMEGAIAQFEMAKSLDSEIVLPAGAATPYFERAKTAYEAGEYEMAIADIETVLEIDPDHELATGVRGMSNLKLEEYDQALLDLLAATQVETASPELFLALGEVQYQHSNLEKALEAFDTVLAQDETMVEAYVLRATVQEELGELDLAVADLSQAIELDPERTDALMALGEVYGQQIVGLTDPDEITALIEKEVAQYTAILELDAENEAALFKRGLAYGKMSAWEEAKADFEAMLAIDEENADAHYQLGLVFSNMDEKDEAIASLERAVELGLSEEDAAEAETLIEELKKPPPLPWAVFRRIPIIPGGFDQVRGSEGEVGFLVFEIEKPVEEVINFYRANMGRMGWAADGEEFSDGFHHLWFKSGGRMALILIGDAGGGITIVGLYEGPL